MCNMKKLILILSAFLLIFAGCSEVDLKYLSDSDLSKDEIIQVMGCIEDYKEKGVSCCSDYNVNNVCDIDEITVDVMRTQNTIDINVNGTIIHLGVPQPGKKVFVPEVDEVEELKIEVLVKDGFSRVEVEMNEIYSEFVLETMNKDIIKEFIATEFDLFPQDIEEVIVYTYRDQTEQQQIENVEIEVEIFNKFSKVEVHKNEVTERFYVSSVVADEIVDIIALKYFMGPGDVREVTTFELGEFFDKDAEDEIYNDLIGEETSSN